MATKTKKPPSRPRNTILLGLAIRERGPSGRWRIRIRWGILLGVFFGLGIAGYCLLVTAFYFYFKEVEDFEEVSYLDMYTVLFNRSDHREKMGNYQIQRAQEALEEGDFRTALQYLRTGVIRSPKNLEGRILLADFFMFGFRPPQHQRAIEILRDGLPYAQEDPEYLKKYVQVLLSFQEDAEIIEIADRILATEPGREVRRILALGAATANYYRGNFDQAEDYLRDYELSADLEGALLSARISWDRGQRQVAVAKLEQDLLRFPDNEPIYEVLTRFHREMGNNSRARQYAVLRNINSPLSIAPRIEMIRLFQLTGESERAQREAQLILKQFANDQNALLRLASVASDSGDAELMNAIYAEALEQDFDMSLFTLLLIETQISSGDYQGAIAFTEQLIRENPTWLDRSRPVFNSLRSVAYFGLGNRDLSELFLNQFLQSTNLRVGTLIAVSERFQNLGGTEEARRVLAEAYRQNPNNQAVLSNLISLEIELGNSAELGDYLHRLLQMRRPSSAILESAYRSLGSDRHLFTRGRQALLVELEQVLQPQSTRSEFQ